MVGTSSAVGRESAPSSLELGKWLDHVEDGFEIFDREWRFVYANRAVCAYVDRPREELLGKVVWELFPGSTNTPMERAFRDAMAAGRPVEFETVAPRSQHWMAFRAFPVDEGLAVFFRDVDEVRRAREALRESEARFRAIFDHSALGLLLTAPTGEILKVNPAACAMLDRTEEEICREGRSGVVDTSDPRLASFLEQRTRTGLAHGEVTLVRKDGSKFEAEATSAVFREADGRDRTSMSFVDVTERKRAERAMAVLADAGRALSESLDVEATLQSFSCLIVPRVADFCVVDVVVGEALERLVIVSKEGAHDEELAEVRRNRPRMTIDQGVGGVWKREASRVIPDVDEAWLRAATLDDAHFQLAKNIGLRSLLMAPMRARGKVVGVLTLGTTTSHQRFTDADLPLAEALAERAGLAIDNARQHAQAVTATRVRDDVLGIVSHDLRNPLNVIKLMTRVLARKGGVDSEVNSIAQAVARADRLIQDLLTTTVLEGGGLSLEREPQSVAPIVHEVVDLHRPIADARGVLLKSGIDEGLPDANLDRHRVTQMLSNLVSNALKATPEHGSVELRARTADDRMVFEVVDTGRGIAPEDMGKLFDRFWQGAASRRTGAGLGLAIVKGIAEAHGGTVTVESEPSKGSCFRVSLPLS